MDVSPIREAKREAPGPPTSRTRRGEPAIANAPAATILPSANVNAKRSLGTAIETRPIRSRIATIRSVPPSVDQVADMPSLARVNVVPLIDEAGGEARAGPAQVARPAAAAVPRNCRRFIAAGLDDGRLPHSGISVRTTPPHPVVLLAQAGADDQRHHDRTDKYREEQHTRTSDSEYRGRVCHMGGSLPTPLRP